MKGTRTPRDPLEEERQKFAEEIRDRPYLFDKLISLLQGHYYIGYSDGWERKAPNRYFPIDK